MQVPRLGLTPGMHRTGMVLGYKHRAKDPWLGLPPGVGGLPSWAHEGSLDLGDRMNPTRLGQKPRVSRTGMVLDPRKHRAGLVPSHGVNLLQVISGCELGSREGQGGLGELVQASVGDQESAVPCLLPRSAWEHPGATWLGAGHVDLVGVDGDPAGPQLLQLHPQDVAVLLQGDTRDCHPHPAGGDRGGDGIVTLNRTWQPL